jgi:hypothetical protein
MIDEIKAKKAQVIRIHDSGDFYNREYVTKWLKIIDSLPNVKFYAYTKSYDLFEGVKIPSNFVLIFSEGSKLPLNTEKRHARVFDSIESLNKAGYVNANENDTEAWNNPSNKIGLVYHGSKKMVDNGFIKGEKRL